MESKLKQKPAAQQPAKSLSPMEQLENEEVAEQKPVKRHMGLALGRHLGNTGAYILLVIISIIWLAPFVFLVLQSFEVHSTGWSNRAWPVEWGFSNYIYLFSAEADFNQWYFNTFVIALFVCVLSTAMQLTMAYVLSRFRFKMRKPLMNFMLILGMFPGFLTMIILYFVLKDLGMTQANAVPGLILVGFASSGMGYYISKGFFDTISKSLDEAAMIDGATRAQIFWKIILPLAKPIVIYSILTSFMAPWGDYVFASYVAFGAPTGYNVAVGLYRWLSTEQISYHYTHFCAGGVVVSIPVITLFLLLQRYYVEGVTGGAVKG
jgi:arabinogalactan oligomer / maltooligosaccharide transport system permease protein